MHSIPRMSERPALRVLTRDHGGAEAQSFPSDEEIVDGIAAGNEWAADALYDRLHPIVDRALRRVLHERTADYDDLVQTTFERIVRTLAERRFVGACSLSTWASAIAGHVGIDALRAAMRDRRLFHRPDSSTADIIELPEPERFERRIEARSEVERIQRILARMKPEHARTLVLHDVLGHELSEIAVLMGVSVAAAQSRLVRGRKELLRRTRAHLAREAP
jgi:RNA polymerase sigma-70 factor (ECF subfamily)